MSENSETYPLQFPRATNAKADTFSLKNDKQLSELLQVKLVDSGG